MPTQEVVYAVGLVCPTCGSKMFDNRGRKQNAKAPDFRCSNKDCVTDDGFRTAVWVRDLRKDGQPIPPIQKPAAKEEAGNGKSVKPGTPPAFSWGALYRRYEYSRRIAVEVWGKDFDPSALVAATATVFIASNQQNMPDPKDPKPEKPSTQSKVPARRVEREEEPGDADEEPY
jgi:hypothetical protein